MLGFICLFMHRLTSTSLDQSSPTWSKYQLMSKATKNVSKLTYTDKFDFVHRWDSLFGPQYSQWSTSYYLFMTLIFSFRHNLENFRTVLCSRFISKRNLTVLVLFKVAFCSILHKYFFFIYVLVGFRILKNIQNKTRIKLQVFKLKNAYIFLFIPIFFLCKLDRII